MRMASGSGPLMATAIAAAAVPLQNADAQRLDDAGWRVEARVPLEALVGVDTALVVGYTGERHMKLTSTGPADSVRVTIAEPLQRRVLATGAIALPKPHDASEWRTNIGGELFLVRLIWQMNTSPTAEVQTHRGVAEGRGR